MLNGSLYLSTYANAKGVALQLGSTERTLPLSLLCAHSLSLVDILDWLQPPNSRFNKLLRLRPQVRLVQLKVIYRTNSAEAKARETAAATIHESSTNGAEGAGHRVARANGFAGTISSELVLTTDVYQRRVLDRKLRSMSVRGQWWRNECATHVRGEHCGSDFAAVFTMANVGVDKVTTFNGLLSVS